MNNNIELDQEEYTAVIRFIRFLRTKNYGKFLTVVNTDKKRGLRSIRIEITDEELIPMKTIVKLV